MTEEEKIMTTTACEWLEIAREDYELANLMHEKGKYLYAVSMCRQAVEEAVKAVYKNRFNKTPPQEQNLIRLAEKAELLVECPADWKTVLSSLNEYHLDSCRPDYLAKTAQLKERCTGELAGETLAAAGKMLAWVKDKIAR